MNLEQIEDKNRIIREGLSALTSINESCHAVSTKKRFRDFTEGNGLECIERDCNHSDLRDGFFLVNSDSYRKFELLEEFRQTGYGAWHIGSVIEEVRKQGKNILIINGRRNRRFLLKEIQ